MTTKSPSSPAWLLEAISEHGPQARRESWGRQEWQRVLGTQYRARVAIRYLRDGEYVPEVKKPVIIAEDGDDGTQGHRYEVSAATGDYRIWIRGRARPVILSADDVRELIASYVSDGDGVTQLALARQFGRTRREINAILKALGVVKDAPPILPEDMAELPEEELAEEWAASKASRVERRAHKKVWSDIERDALRWRDLERSAFQYVAASVRRAVDTCVPVSLPSEPVRGSCALVIVPTDVHIGKRGWRGFSPNDVTSEETTRRLWAAVRRVLDLAPADPEVIYLTIGGDLFHVDTGTGTTTRGTPQDLDVTPEEMIATVIPLLFGLVRALALVAPVRLVLHAGNHDAILSIAAYAALLEGFRGQSRVEPAGDPDHPFGPYQAVRYGASLLGFTHGDGRHKVGDLAPLMAQRWPKLWAETRYRYWFVGHRHHMAAEEARGVEVHTAPSIAGADRYHARHWPHETRPRLGGYVLDKDRGMVAQVWGDID